MSVKVLVIYKSKYGSAERYARWIAEETNGDLLEASSVKAENLKNYDVIVFGGSLYAVGIIGFSVIKNNFELIKDKKVIVFSVGASPAHPEVMEEIKKSNFTPEMTRRIEYFHLRGAFDFKKLKPVDKVMMYLLKKKIQFKAKRGNLTNDEKGMLASYSRPVNWTKKEAITPILKSIEEFKK